MAERVPRNFNWTFAITAAALSMFALDRQIVAIAPGAAPTAPINSRQVNGGSPSWPPTAAPTAR